MFYCKPFCTEQDDNVYEKAEEQNLLVGFIFLVISAVSLFLAGVSYLWDIQHQVKLFSGANESVSDPQAMVFKNPVYDASKTQSLVF
tara:strand:+ start:221 stop:481 length:261 start_codon:yes stop_codon:yes gene_type:complete